MPKFSVECRYIYIYMLISFLVLDCGLDLGLNSYGFIVVYKPKHVKLLFTPEGKAMYVCA